ncbi:hypothetical protein [Tessaracoccus antarcticus]|nr:hypothetical protein [Tessaracoccus antarcticus]
MSATPERVDEATVALSEDVSFERGLLWKGLFSLVVVLALAYARMRWWL